MNPALARYLKKLLILSAITAIVMLTMFFAKAELISPALPFVLAFFAAVSLLAFVMLLRKMNDKTGKFVNTFMTQSMGRMILYLVIITSYALLNRPDAIRFIIGFFILYIIFTIFEVLQFLRISRERNKS
ncbi:MAG TPA: hypothetical protein PLV51_08630 [Lentimicrobium sp.]|nr:hypothetical protein [Lentimicrobium sp.]